MKTLKVIYWITTSLITIGMLFTVYNYFFNPALKAGYAHLGFPDWFRVELGIAKLLGALALILPFIPRRLKEWAYVGFFINFFSAFLAHFMVGDALNYIISPLVFLLVLTISYYTFLQIFERGSTTVS